MLILCVSAAALTDAAERELFFKGKSVRFIVATSAGGGFDTYTRTIARHIGRHIPGNPTALVENMPGAGQLIGTKYMYNQAKPDGLTIGNFHGGGRILQQMLEGDSLGYDMRNFEWIGLPVSDTQVCVLTKNSGIGSLKEWLAATKPVKLGATGLGSGSFEIAHLVKAALGLPIQVVSGYKGSADIRLAADSGEVDGGCWNWESIKVTWRKSLEAGDVKVILQAMPEKHHPDLRDVPLANDFAKDKQSRQLLKIGIQDPAVIVRVYSLPPGTPKDRVATLRTAFMSTMRDPQFLAEAKKSNLDLEPKSGEEIETLVRDYFKSDPSVVGILKEILKPKR